MENIYEAGDLTDVIRIGSGDGGSGIGSTAEEYNWPMNYYSSEADEYFGDPFADVRDPFLNTPQQPGLFFHDDHSDIINGAAATELINHKINNLVGDQEMKSSRPNNNNMFSRMMHQICPQPKSSSPNSSKAAGCSQQLESPAAPALQISSPRNTAIKRSRKSQAKKVVCIPAPAPANSRPTGEIVPSDLWAWRKYGQKPIKGSPYPRGYYRCSSSKGCLARKQVERSRTDPNMLVITYTSEHNHPWPTQRNALAGSTRSSHTSKITTTCTKSRSQPQKSPKNIIHKHQNPAVVKEEMNAQHHFDEQELIMEDDDVLNFPHTSCCTYKPTMPAADQSTTRLDDTTAPNFFVDIGSEIQAEDSLNLLFTQAGLFSDNKTTLDPFAFYDWASGNVTTSNCTAFDATAQKDS